MKPSEIRKLRLKSGLSQQAFATELGMSIAACARWESGTSEPSPLALRALKDMWLKTMGEEYA